MLLNSDIQKKICSNDFTLSKRNKCHYVHYWIFLKTWIISFGQNFNKIWIFKVYVFVMFKMKYLINKMQCNILSQQVGWFDSRGVYFHPKNLSDQTSQMVCAVNSGKLIEYSFI